MWQHFASLLWIGEYAPVPVIITGAFFCLQESVFSPVCILFITFFVYQPE